MGVVGCHAHLQLLRPSAPSFWMSDAAAACVCSPPAAASHAILLLITAACCDYDGWVCLPASDDVMIDAVAAASCKACIALLYFGLYWLHLHCQNSCARFAVSALLTAVTAAAVEQQSGKSAKASPSGQALHAQFSPWIRHFQSVWEVL